MSESRLEIVLDIAKNLVIKIVHIGLLWYGLAFIYFGSMSIDTEGYIYSHKPYVITSFIAFIYFVVFTSEHLKSLIEHLYYLAIRVLIVFGSIFFLIYLVQHSIFTKNYFYMDKTDTVLAFIAFVYSVTVASNYLKDRYYEKKYKKSTQDIEKEDSSNPEP